MILKYMTEFRTSGQEDANIFWWKFALLSQPTLDERDYDCCKIWIMRRDCVKLARMFSSSRSGFHGIVSPDPSSRL